MNVGMRFDCDDVPLLWGLKVLGNSLHEGRCGCVSTNVLGTGLHKGGHVSMHVCVYVLCDAHTFSTLIVL